MLRPEPAHDETAAPPRKERKPKSKPRRVYNEAHVAFIKALGGPERVARLIEANGGGRITHQAVSMWSIRGIPHKHRPLLGSIALPLGLDLPPKFYLPNQE